MILCQVPGGIAYWKIKLAFVFTYTHVIYTRVFQSLNRSCCGQVAVTRKWIDVTKVINKPHMVIIGMCMEMKHLEPTNYSVMISHIFSMLQPRVIITKIEVDFNHRT